MGVFLDVGGVTTRTEAPLGKYTCVRAAEQPRSAVAAADTLWNGWMFDRSGGAEGAAIVRKVSYAEGGDGNSRPGSAVYVVAHALALATRQPLT